jgi:glutamate-1-semialdehyde 2,1-aminomutase
MTEGTLFAPSALAEDAYARSRALHARASERLAGGVSTAFRMYERPVPLFIREAKGARLTDVDGREYVDFACGFGPVILGHGHERVTAAVAAAAANVQQVGAQHEAEIELAELLCESVPAFDVVRFGVTGSEAIHAALRLARAATGRPLVVKFAGHYHGWLDTMYTGTAHVGPAVPESAGQGVAAIADVLVCDWNEREALDRLLADHGDLIAAVVMEPIPCNQGVMFPHAGYLEHVRELTAEAGALLVFDEVITGFRIALGGAQDVTGVTPDLAVVAKAMANGFPISAFGGRRDLMGLVATNRVVHAGTFNGGGISVAASLATIRELTETEGIHDRMHALGQRLMAGLRTAADRHGHRLVVQGPGSVFFAWLLAEGEVTSYRDHLRADAARYAGFAELMLGEGVRVIPAGRWYLSAAHDEAAIDETIAAADRAFARLPS